MSTEHDNIFSAYALGIQRTLRLNDLIHFFLSALTSPAGGNFTAALLFLFNKRSHVLQGMLGITQETSRFALPPEATRQTWCHPRITVDIQRHQRDDDFNRAAIRLRFQLAAQRRSPWPARKGAPAFYRETKRGMKLPPSLTTSSPPESTPVFPCPGAKG